MEERYRENYLVLRELRSLMARKEEVLNLIAAEETRIEKIKKRQQQKQERLDEVHHKLLGDRNHEQELNKRVAQYDLKIRQMEKSKDFLVSADEVDKFEKQKETYRETLNALEDDTLSVLEAIEKSEEESTELQKFITGVEGTLKEIQLEIDEINKKYQAEISTLEDRMKNLEGILDPEFLNAFKLAVKKRGSDAFTLLKGQTCTSCGVGISKVDEQNIQGKGQVSRCTQCSRLFLPQSILS